MDTRQEDPLITELRRFLESWVEHDPDCPARTLGGPAVRDPGDCTCELTVREAEIIAKLAARLDYSNRATSRERARH